MTHGYNEKYRHGFTLLEVLIAVTILVMMTGMVYASLSAVVNATTAARETAEHLRYRQYITRNLNENMTAIYADAGVTRTPYTLEGIDEEGPLGPADSLSFVSSLPMPGALALPGMMKRVTYEVLDASSEEEGTFGGLSIDQGAAGEKNQVFLQITEAPLILGEPTDDYTTSYENVDETIRQRRVPIRSMDIHYYDFSTEDWVDEWNSIDELRMPWAIRFIIHLARTDEVLDEEFASGMNVGDAPDIDLSFTLPMSAGTLEDSVFYDFNHYSTSDLEGSELDLGGLNL